MTTPQQPALAYVLKRYPRFSETFIVNEILEHEKAGMRIHIFALRPVRESHFQDILAQVRAPVTYIRDIRERRRRPPTDPYPSIRRISLPPSARH